MKPTIQWIKNHHGQLCSAYIDLLGRYSVEIKTEAWPGSEAWKEWKADVQAIAKWNTRSVQGEGEDAPITGQSPVGAPSPAEIEGLVERAKQYAADCLECAADQRQTGLTEMPVRWWNAAANDWQLAAAEFTRMAGERDFFQSGAKEAREYLRIETAHAEAAESALSVALGEIERLKGALTDIRLSAEQANLAGLCAVIDAALAEPVKEG